MEADKGKYCRYHQNMGHNIEECSTLRDKIEEVIRVGHLRRYVKVEQKHIPSGNKQVPPRDDMRKEDRQDRDKTKNRPLRGVINTISGGFAGGGGGGQLHRQGKAFEELA